MKIECNKTKLLRAIQKADRVVGKNQSLPVLSCLIFEAKDKKVFIKSTNLELGVMISVPAKVFKEGEVAILSSILVSYMNNLSIDENLILEQRENLLLISGSKNETKMNTVSTEDFPVIPNTKRQKICKLSSKELLEGFRSVFYAASSSSIKPELSSVYIYQNGNEIIFVATDSFRLAEKKISTKVSDFESVLIPQKNVYEIIRIFEDVEGDIIICFEEDKISFEYENDIYLVSRVVDGSFPDYKQIILKESKTEVNLLKNDLINALKVSNIFSNNFNQVNFIINQKNNIFEISSKSVEKGENKTIVSSNITGESLEINFNQKYINDSFGSIGSESLILNFNGNGKPLVVRGVGDGSFQYLVMPLNK